MRNLYDRFKSAYHKKHGLRLSALDVQLLMTDTAIRDAVLETWSGESAAKEEEKQVARAQRRKMDDSAERPTEGGL